MTYDVVVDGKTHQLELTQGDQTWRCKVDGQEIDVDPCSRRAMCFPSWWAVRLTRSSANAHCMVNCTWSLAVHATPWTSKTRARYALAAPLPALRPDRRG